jgi:hypothetical protein
MMIAKSRRPEKTIAQLVSEVTPPAALAAAESDLAELRSREVDLRARLSVATQHTRSPIAGSQMRAETSAITGELHKVEARF